jgi:hypothetical protein
MKLNLTFFTLFVGRSMRVFIGGAKLVLWVKVRLRGAICQATRIARVAEQLSFLAALTLGIGCPVHQPSLTRWQSEV